MFRYQEALAPLSRALACYEREGRVGAYIADTHYNLGVALAGLGRYRRGGGALQGVLSGSCRTTPAGAWRSAMPWPARERDRRDTRNEQTMIEPAARKAVHGPLLRSRSQPPRASGDPAGLPAGCGGRARLDPAHRGPGPAPPRSHVGPLPPAPDGGSLRRGRRNGARAHLALDPGQPLELPRVRGPGPGGRDRRPRHDRLGGARSGPSPPGAAGRRPARLPAGAAPRDRRRFPAAAAPGVVRAGAAFHGAAERPRHEPPRQQRRLCRVGPGIGAG